MSEEEKKHYGQISISDVDIKDLSDGSEPGHMPDSRRLDTHHIVEIPLPKTQTIHEFRPHYFKDSKSIKYSNVKSTFPESASELDAMKNQRFRINPLTRGPLSVEAEEEERIETEVQGRVENRFNLVRDQVHKQGYQEGFSVGKKDGYEEAKTHTKPMVDSITKVLRDFETMRSEMFKTNEEFLIRMVYKIAKSVILREVKEDKEYVKRLVLEILERLGTSDNIKIFISPGEESSAQVLKDELAKVLGQFKNITVEMDNRIQTTGCRVETDFSEVDARLEVQIENIAKSLVEKG